MRTFIITIILLLLISTSLYYFSRQLQQQSEKSQVKKPPQTEILQLPEEEAPSIKHPIAEPPTILGLSTDNEVDEPDITTVFEPPLPTLEESDAAIKNTLLEVFRVDILNKLINFRGILHRFVVTVDNLTEKKLSSKFRLNLPAPGKFLVRKDASGNIYVDPDNLERYRLYMQFIEAIDPEQFVKQYTYFYPLIQEAYDALGYKERYFNDRFIAVIDHLLTTPDVNKPIRLVQPKVFYKYADPKLESLSAGQKIMLRIGQSNLAIVKAKLLAIRTALVTPINDE